MWIEYLTSDNLEMEVIDIQRDSQLKERFKQVELLEFYKNFLPREK